YPALTLLISPIPPRRPNATFPIIIQFGRCITMFACMPVFSFSRKYRFFLAVACSAASAAVAAQEPIAPASSDAVSVTSSSAVTTLKPVTVTSTQIERSVFDVPASVDLIDGASMRDSHMQVNLSEGLAGVPGMLIQ